MFAVMTVKFDACDAGSRQKTCTIYWTDWPSRDDESLNVRFSEHKRSSGTRTISEYNGHGVIESSSIILINSIKAKLSIVL